MTLTIPTQRDPLARGALLLLIAGVIYALAATLGSTSTPQAQAQGVIILDATATPALPEWTPVPAVELAAATPAPGWLDRQLASAADTANGFANDQANQLAHEQADAAAAEQAAHDQYLANVGAQAAHSPRGDVNAPPAYTSGPVVYPAENIIIDPNPAPAPAGIAVQSPPISQEQAAIIGARQSNGCAAGEVFYPRTGCHQPGSGGPQPGAVGAP